MCYPRMEMRYSGSPWIMMVQALQEEKSKFIQGYVSISINKKYYLFRVEGT